MTIGITVKKTDRIQIARIWNRFTDELMGEVYTINGNWWAGRSIMNKAQARIWAAEQIIKEVGNAKDNSNKGSRF